MLAAVWSLRTGRVATGETFTPDQTVEECIADVRRLVFADWQVATTTCTDMAGTHSSWFPGRPPTMDVVEFETRWCTGGVIAHVTQGAHGRGPSMEFRLAHEASGLPGERAGDSGGGGGGT